MTFHRHRCPSKKCGHIWRHADRSFLDQLFDPRQGERHRCPKCGRLQLHKFNPKVPGCDGYIPPKKEVRA